MEWGWGFSMVGCDLGVPKEDREFYALGWRLATLWGLAECLGDENMGWEFANGSIFLVIKYN